MLKEELVIYKYNDFKVEAKEMIITNDNQKCPTEDNKLYMLMRFNVFHNNYLILKEEEPVIYKYNNLKVKTSVTDTAAFVASKPLGSFPS